MLEEFNCCEFILHSGNYYNTKNKCYVNNLYLTLEEYCITKDVIKYNFELFVSTLRIVLEEGFLEIAIINLYYRTLLKMFMKI